jgi:hypothetical protein
MGEFCSEEEWRDDEREGKFSSYPGTETLVFLLSGRWERVDVLSSCWVGLD